MIGEDGIGFHAVAEMITNIPFALTLNPVSKIETGSGNSPKSAQAAVLTIADYIQWDDNSYILWDDSTPIEWDTVSNRILWENNTYVSWDDNTDILWDN